MTIKFTNLHPFCWPREIWTSSWVALLLIFIQMCLPLHANTVRRSGDRHAPFPRELEVYDDFDGHGGFDPYSHNHLAVQGGLSPELWNGDAEVICPTEGIPDLSEHGCVLELSVEKGQEEGGVVELTNPRSLADFNDGSFSADMLVPLDPDSMDFAASLAVYAWVPEFSDDPYWSASIWMHKNPSGDISINWGWYDRTSDKYEGGSIEASPETWYNLRIDVVRSGISSLKFTFYVDSQRMFEGSPADSEILRDPSRITSGPTRQFWIWRPSADVSARVFIDNVNADYRRLSLTEIEPATAAQGQRVSVTIRGDDFSDAIVPFSTAWGLSFVDIEFLDANTIQATALVDQLAPPGDRVVRLAAAGLANEDVLTDFFEASNAVNFTVIENQDLPLSPIAYGVFEDYDDPDRDGDYDAQISDLVTGRGSGKNRLVYTSEAHPETFPQFSQANGSLEVWTAFDPIGYYDTVRFAEPESFYEKYRNMLRIARSVSVVYEVPSAYVNWRSLGLEFEGWYIAEEDGDRIHRGLLWMMNSDEEGDVTLEYRVFKWGNSLPWSSEVGGYIQWSDFVFDGPVRLRYDVVVPDENTFFYDLFANDQLMARIFPDDSDFLLNRANWGDFEDIEWGSPIRVLKTGRPQAEDGLLYSIDRIDGVFPMIHSVLRARAKPVSEGNRIVFDSNPVNDYHLSLENPGLQNGKHECHHKLSYEIYETSGYSPELLTTIDQTDPSPQTFKYVHTGGGPDSRYSIVTSFVKGWRSQPVELALQ